MLRFEYPYSYDYRLPVTPQLGVGVYFPSFPPNATVMNGDGSDSEQSSFDDFNNNNFSNDDNNNNNNMIMNDNNDNNNNNNEPINEEPSLLPDSLPSDNAAPSSEYYATTPLFSPKTMNASNDYSTTTTPNHRNSISISVPSDDLSVFVMGEGGNESKNELVTDINEFPTVDLLPPPMTSLPPLPVGTAAAASETDDEELFRAKKQKPSNDTTTIAPKKSTARRGRKSAAAKAAEAAAAAAVTSTTSLSSSAASSSVAAVAAVVSVAPSASENHRKTSTGSDEDNDYSDSPHSSHHSSSEHYRTKHSISETRRRTRLRNQFKYLAEASASAKTDRYSVLCAAIVKIEAAKRRIAELEAQVAAATVGSSMAGLSPMPAVSSAPSAMCCAESIEYGVCSQCSGVATALLSGDGVGTFLSANHRWLSLIGVNSLPELQSIAPSFLKVVGTSNAEVSNARSTLSAVSAHKHGSMTLPLDSNTILAYKNHSDSSIEPALLYANIRHFPTKSCRPALFTLSSYEHGAADNRNPCVLVTAVPCEPLPEGVTVSSYNDRLAHRGRKAGGGHTSPPASDSSSSINNNATNGTKKEGKKRSYSQRVASSRLNGGEGEGFALNARIGNHLMMDEGL